MNALLPSKQTSGKRERSPAYIGGLCAVTAAFLPLAHPVLFILGSMPLLLAAFVLAIVSIVRGKIGGGVSLLVGLVLALTMSVVSAGAVLGRRLWWTPAFCFYLLLPFR